MKSLIFYGTGGQGLVTSAKILSEAVSLYENQFAVTIPSYGAERRGAPVNTSIVIDSEVVLVNSFVYHPDVVVVFDHTINEKDVDVAAGIHKDTILIINTESASVLDTYKKLGFELIYYVDGTSVALENIGVGIPNTSMLGAMANAGIVNIESVEKTVRDTFGKDGDRNARAAREAYTKTKKA